MYLYSPRESSLLSEKAMAPHSSTLAWKIPWMAEPGRLQFLGSLRVGHGWATSLSFFTFTHWRRKWQSTPVFLPGESQGWGARLASIYGVARSRTGLKRLSSSRSILPGNKPACENSTHLQAENHITVIFILGFTLSNSISMLRSPFLILYICVF